MKILETYVIKKKHYKQTRAKALCPICNQIVDRQYSNAKKQESCGCQRGKLKGKEHYFYKHGREPIELYRKWKSIKDRCNRKENKYFYRYGARGISMFKG